VDRRLTGGCNGALLRGPLMMPVFRLSSVLDKRLKKQPMNGHINDHGIKR